MNARRIAIFVAIAALAGGFLWTTDGIGPRRLGADAGPLGGVRVAGVVTPLLQYQGRLTDPATGASVADGNYTMTFRFYDVAGGGSSLWTETKDVLVQGGVLNTVLGDTTSLDQDLFNGQELWLGIKVGADAEATPRQRVLAVAYALSLAPGAVIEASSSDSILRLTNTGSGEGLRVRGRTVLEGDLTVNGNLTGGSHNHSGAAITSGAVSQARIDDAIARDSEIMPTVLSSDGADSGLDADKLDGQQASAFAASAHTHSGSSITSGTVVEARIDAAIARDSEIMPSVLGSDGAGSGLDADKLDGQQASAFAATSHTHDSRYYTESESNSRYVNASGDTMSGALAVPKVTYTAPRTHYLIIGSEGFFPASNVDFGNSWGNGGAYINSGYGALVAPVHLPHGAVVTRFEVFFSDTSSSDADVRLQLQGLSSSYTVMAQVSSSGISGYGSGTDASISNATISNTSRSYAVRAYSSSWDSSLRIKAALITYTVGEAQ